MCACTCLCFPHAEALDSGKLPTRPISCSCVSQALKARAQQGYQDGSLAVQQLYNALNLQKEVALSQVGAFYLKSKEQTANLGLEGTDFRLNVSADCQSKACLHTYAHGLICRCLLCRLHVSRSFGTECKSWASPILKEAQSTPCTSYSRLALCQRLRNLPGQLPLKTSSGVFCIPAPYYPN